MGMSVAHGLRLATLVGGHVSEFSLLVVARNPTETG